MTANTAFGLSDYRFIEFSYKRYEGDNLALNLAFLPSGIYHPQTGIFSLTLIFTCSIEKEAIEVVKGTLQAEFRFNTPIPLAEIPAFFYVNSIAIVFPYVRAFISTVTLQANSGLVILPTLNLTSLEKVLKEGTKEAV